ncbi:DUF490 domain-containing protein [Bacteroidia bacterium]|nr:DUF490 domain-containing protein [Bacteroidia bacterium]
MVKDIALREMRKKVQCEMSIGSIKFTPFNHIHLKEVYIAGEAGDTLFYAENLTMNFKLFGLLDKELGIHSAGMDDFFIHISKKTAQSPFNFQFLVDAFSSDTQSSDSSKMNIAIGKIVLGNGRLRYDIFSEPTMDADWMDFNHLDIQNFSLAIDLKSIDLENLDAEISNISFEEKSGFILNELKTSIKTKGKLISTDEIKIELPNSELAVQSLKLDYAGMALVDILTGAVYSFQLSSKKMNLADLKCFSTGLEKWPDKFTLSGMVEGKFPQIRVSELRAGYGTHLLLQAEANWDNFNRPEDAAFALNVEKFFIDKTGIEQIMNLSTENESGSKVALPANMDSVFLSGTMTGSLPDFTVDLKLDCNPFCELNLNGAGGYLLSSRAMNFEAHVGLKHLNYESYSLQNVQIDGGYSGDTLRFSAAGEDRNFPLKLWGALCVEKKNQSLQFYADIDRLPLDSLKILPAYQGSELSGNIELNVIGFDPELMSATLSIENLNFSSSEAHFEDSPISVSYSAGANHRKEINIRSKVLSVRGKGALTYSGIKHTFKNAFPVFYKKEKKKAAQKIQVEDNFNYFIAIRQSNTVAQLLGLETHIPDSAFIIGKYTGDGENLNMKITAGCLFNETDTAKLVVNLENEESKLLVELDAENKSPFYALQGSLLAAVEFIPAPADKIPDMNISLKPTSMALNDTAFQIYPAQISISKNRYEIQNFALRHSTSEYLKINGVISEERNDSLLIDINMFQIGTLLGAVKNKIPLSGLVNGEIAAAAILKTPLLYTRDFAIDTLCFDGNNIGNIKLSSLWSSSRQGLLFRATLNNPESPESLVSGYILPEKDSLTLTGNIQGLKMKWFAHYLSGTLYGLDGEFGARFKVNGKISDPLLSGAAFFKEAKVGVIKTHTVYEISDSIYFKPGEINFNQFIVYDETRKNGKINGTITHKQFRNLNPHLTINLNNFLALNNQLQVDSLYYGMIRVNGNLNVSIQQDKWFIQGNINNGKSGTVMLNIPESAMEAKRYNWITFVNSNPEKKENMKKIAIPAKTGQADENGFSLPLKMKIDLSINPNLNVGVVLNPDTKDLARISGSGIVTFNYDLSNSSINLQGNYEVSNGKCTLSLKNITRKTFSVEPGGRLIFRGDPMNTSFNLTAIYKLRANLATLDPSFMNTSKVPVNCLLSANGTMQKMQLGYKVTLPNESDDVQKKVDGLLYSDDMKIKEIAYLLAFGSFMPVNYNSTSNKNSEIWSSLASSSVTAQLNNLLSGVLKDNWTIGTDLHAGDANFSNVGMDVNISTGLFNNRLMINSTLGYHNDVLQNDNFTGDFDLEYKLSPKGNVLLRFFNFTNNQYYDKARLTQGVGIVYKKKGRTFKQLFKDYYK